MRFMTTIALSALISVSGQTLAESERKHDEAAILNYSIGYQVGSDFRLQGFELRPEMVLKGIEDAINNTPQLSQPELRQSMAELGNKVAELKRKIREQSKTKPTYQDSFLVENASKDGVITTDSGLQYKVLKQGSGAQPGPGNTVVVHYRGTLTDGTEFDSSYKRNQPAQFRVDRVIKGWTEALQLMNTGAKWELYIPAKLGYGARGAGNKIPPNSTLIFEVELIAVK